MLKEYFQKKQLKKHVNGNTVVLYGDKVGNLSLFHLLLLLYYYYYKDYFTAKLLLSSIENC